MTKTTPEQNKALVLEAFETLFNSATMPAQNVFGRIATFSTAPISRLAAWTFRSGSLVARDPAMRTN